MKEKNIRQVAKRMGLITTDDMCHYTIPQLVVAVANKVNEMVSEIRRFETEVDESIQTQLENIDYLMNEGLHLEVADIFEGWVKDGTFDQLINESAIKATNERIDETNEDLSELDDVKLDRNEQNSISMGMLTQEVKATLTGGKVAIVGVDSVGYLQLKRELQNDIMEKVTLAGDYIEHNAEVSGSNVIISSSQWYKHRVIDVSEGERYDLTIKTSNNTGVKYCIFSNDNKQYISHLIDGIDTSQTLSTTVTVPAGASKMYVNGDVAGNIIITKYAYSKIATKNEVKTVENAVAGVDNKINSTKDSVKRLNDELKIYKELRVLAYENRPSGYDNNQGTATPSSSVYYKSIICNCSGLDTIYVTFKTLNNPSVYYIHFVRDNFKVVSSLCNNYSQTTVITDLELKVPEGATKVIINTDKTFDCHCKKFDFANFQKQILKEMEIPYVQGGRYIIQNDKAIRDTSDGSKWYTTSVIDVKNSDKYYISLSWTYETYHALIFTDGDDNVVSAQLKGTGSKVSYQDYEVVVPDGAVKMIVQNENNMNPPIVKKYVFNYEKQEELSIPPYSVEYLNEKISLINQCEYEIGSDGDCFIFITDIHIDDNRLISASLIDEIIKQTNIKKVIFGGDLLKNSMKSETQIIEFCKLFKQKYGHHPICSVLGNHDLLGFNSETHLAEHVQSDSMRYALLGKMQEDYCTFGNNKGFYYYSDNKNQKIRYIGLNLYESTETQRGSLYVSDEQIQWLKGGALEGLTSEWGIVFVSHAGLTTDTFHQADNPYIQKVKSTIEEINGRHKVICCLSGHMHKDLNGITSGIRHISFPCDASYPDDGINRTTGTNTEYCFDVVCINKTSKKIKCIRIGAGSDREFDY